MAISLVVIADIRDLHAIDRNACISGNTTVFVRQWLAGRWMEVVISGSIVIGAGVGGRWWRRHCSWGQGGVPWSWWLPELRVVVAAVVDTWAGVVVICDVIDDAGGDEQCRSLLRGVRGISSTGCRRPCWSLEVLCGHYCCHQNATDLKAKNTYLPGTLGMLVWSWVLVLVPTHIVQSKTLVKVVHRMCTFPCKSGTS